MFVFIAHAEADQASADELKAFLKRRGLIAETETGERGFRYLQSTDVVIGLWSQKSTFDTHRILLERRMLDAWADAQLVLVKLDHSVLPVGVRDLPAIDATFVQARDLNGWPQAERAARQAMNQALVKRANGSAVGGAAPPAAPVATAIVKHRPGALAAPSSSTRQPEGGGVALTLVTLALAGAVGGVWYYNWRLPAAAAEIQSLVLIAGGVAHIGFAFALISLLSHASSAGEIRRRARAVATAQSRSVTAIRDELAVEPTEDAEKLPTAVFVSYSHADNAAVEPVVKAARDNGREVWIDKSGIQTGDGWAGEIVRAIRNAHGLMVMCSKHAFESDHVKRELYLADRYKKPMAPIFLEDAKPPEDFEYFFAGVQWLELYKVPEGERRDAIGKALSAV